MPHLNWVDLYFRFLCVYLSDWSKVLPFSDDGCIGQSWFLQLKIGINHVRNLLSKSFSMRGCDGWSNIKNKTRQRRAALVSGQPNIGTICRSHKMFYSSMDTALVVLVSFLMVAVNRIKESGHSYLHS